MSNLRRSFRPANPTATASAALALLAIAAAMSSMPATSQVRGGVPTETRSTLSEAQTIRDVAQAVVAAARELVGSERIVPEAAIPQDFLATSPSADPLVVPHPFDHADQIRLCPISNERLLDLPPPAC